MHNLGDVLQKDRAPVSHLCEWRCSWRPTAAPRPCRSSSLVNGSPTVIGIDLPAGDWGSYLSGS